MTYSIFDSTGNLVDAFNDRAAALDCLAGIAQAEPESGSEVFLIAQDDAGNTVGKTVFAFPPLFQPDLGPSVTGVIGQSCTAPGAGRDAPPDSPIRARVQQL
jgi:hypothetical protein